MLPRTTIARTTSRVNTGGLGGEEKGVARASRESGLAATTAGSSQTTDLEAQHDLTGLFVANLTQATPDNILRQALTFHFSRFGSVLSVKIKREKDVRTVAPRKKEGDVWGWVWYEFPEEATNALEQSQGIRVLGRTLRVERAKAHRMLLVEPREGVSFERSPTSGSWLIRIGEQQMDLQETVGELGDVQMEERRRGGGVLIKVSKVDGHSALQRLEGHPLFRVSLHNETHARVHSEGPPSTRHGHLSIPSISLPRRAVSSDSFSIPHAPSRGDSEGHFATRPPLLHRRSKSNISQTSRQPPSTEEVFQVPPHDPSPHAPSDSRVSSESHRLPPPPLRLVIPEQQVAGPYPGSRQELPYYSATLEHGYDLAGQNIVIDTSAIFVGGLDKQLVDPQILAEKFRPYGHIIDLHLVRYAPNTSSGFAFVTYDNAESAARAVEGEHGTFFFGQTIRVQLREIRPRNTRHLQQASSIYGLPDFAQGQRRGPHQMSTNPTAPNLDPPSSFVQELPLDPRAEAWIDKRDVGRPSAPPSGWYPTPETSDVTTTSQQSTSSVRLDSAEAARGWIQDPPTNISNPVPALSDLSLGGVLPTEPTGPQFGPQSTSSFPPRWVPFPTTPAGMSFYPPGAVVFPPPSPQTFAGQSSIALPPQSPYFPSSPPFFVTQQTPFLPVWPYGPHPSWSGQTAPYLSLPPRPPVPLALPHPQAPHPLAHPSPSALTSPSGGFFPPDPTSGPSASYRPPPLLPAPSFTPTRRQPSTYPTTTPRPPYHRKPSSH